MERERIVMPLLKAVVYGLATMGTAWLLWSHAGHLK